MPQDDSSLPWAWPSLCQRKGLSLRRSPWDDGDHPDPAEEAARQVAARASIWAQAPGAARMLRIPRPSREDLAALWVEWHSLCVTMQLPQLEEWVEREQG